VFFDRGRSVRAVGELMEDMVDAMNRGAIDVCRNIWHPDGRELAPNAPVMRGRQSVLYDIDKRLQKWSQDMELRCEEIHVSGSWAFTTGPLTIRSVPRAGGDVQFLDGKFLAILRRERGMRWRLYRYCYNSSVPVVK
jgi:ketosteroid isomerase-like protein